MTNSKSPLVHVKAIKTKTFSSGHNDWPMVTQFVLIQ